MTAYSRYILCTACIVLVILAGTIAGCTSYQTAPAPAAPPAVTGGGNAVAINNFAFDPPTMTVKTGTTVTWTNYQDGVPHIIASDTGSPMPFSSDSLSTGASYSFTFTKPGTYAYHCSIHPSMKGTVLVQ